MKAKAAIIVKPKVIRLLASSIRFEILRLLGNKPMTETQLSKELGITKAAVGYHLNSLRKAGLIEITKYETGEHGISKYYSATAVFFIVDPNQIPKDVKRHFLETQMEYLEGMLSVFKLYNVISEVSSENLEELAKQMMEQLKIVGQRYVEKVGEEDAESLRVKIYAEALASLTEQKVWPFDHKPSIREAI